jgi:DNA-directed RNA polymerase specialized sigma subunit
VGRGHNRNGNKRLTDAEWELVSKHLNLVDQQIAIFTGRRPDDSSTCEAMHAAGSDALVRAARAWKPDGKTKFKTYATVCVRNGVRKEAKRIAGHGSDCLDRIKTSLDAPISDAYDGEDRTLNDMVAADLNDLPI